MRDSPSSATSRPSSLLAAFALAALIVPAALVAATGALPATQATTPPSPESSLGFQPCADYKLATSERIAAYFRQLAAASGRVRLLEIGTTTGGRPQLLAVISSEANIAQLDRFKNISRTLAMARNGRELLTDDAARALARNGKAVVWIDFGLHSTEVATAQTAPLLAYRIVTDESSEMRSIRDNVIVLLNPDMNPDGTTYVADWYIQNVGTAWEGQPPELWHPYAGHDNNRDWFMMTQRETRNSARQLYAEWLPQIVYDHHQSAPFPARIFIPPFDDPMNPNIPPLVIRGVNVVGDAIARRLDQEGKRGAISRIGFDTWWNGGMRTAPYFHNMVGILTETGHASPTPIFHDAATFPKVFSNGAPTLQPSSAYRRPYLGGEWHVAASCDYMIAGSLAVLAVAAERREEWLYDIYRMGRDAIARHGHETFLIPPDQWDAPTAVKMINILRLGGVEVERASAPFAVARKQYGAGTYVIRGRQPFAAYVRDLLMAQRYPDLRPFPGGPPKRPYDIAGWTLSYQMGVTIDRVNGEVDASTEQIDVAPVPSVAPPTRAVAFAIDPRQNDAFILVNRLLKGGAVVRRSARPVRIGDSDWPPGTFLVTTDDGDLIQRLADTAKVLGVNVAALDRVPGATTRLTSARIGIYHGWGGNIDEGWTRWVLEQFEFPYSRLHDSEVRAGNLRARFDVIVLPDATYAQMVNGLAPGSMPEAYTGGMGLRGVQQLYDFTAAGGTLVALDRAVELPVTAFRLPITSATAGVPESRFYVPGSILRLTVDAADPVGYGMPRDSAAFFLQGAVLTVAPRDGVRIVAHYPSRDVLMSGWLLGERLIAGKATVVDARIGRGRVVLLAFRAQNRGQSHGTFKFLFNSVMLANPP